MNHRYNYQLLDPTSGVEKKVHLFFKDLIVMDGLFVGMKYPSFKAICSALIPKLSGTYENELNVIFQKLRVNKYDIIVMLNGCEREIIIYTLILHLLNTTRQTFTFINTL